MPDGVKLMVGSCLTTRKRSISGCSGRPNGVICAAQVSIGPKGIHLLRYGPVLTADPNPSATRFHMGCRYPFRALTLERSEGMIACSGGSSIYPLEELHMGLWPTH